MSRKIMIVSADAGAAHVMRLVLELNGYEAAEAYSGEECLKRIKEERPDMVLLDAILPGMDGWGVLRQIKRDEALRGIPAVMLTVKPLDAETIGREGIKDLADYITQPYSKEDLIACVRETLGQ